MKLVLDTNVLVAAFVAHGTCHEVLEHCVRNHTLVASEYILEEFARALDRLGLDDRAAAQALALLRSRATVVEPADLGETVSRDPSDDPVLRTAIAAGCEVLVSGDQDLLVLHTYRDVRILGPSDFWKVESGEP